MQMTLYFIKGVTNTFVFVKSYGEHMVAFVPRLINIMLNQISSMSSNWKPERHNGSFTLLPLDGHVVRSLVQSSFILVLCLGKTQGGKCGQAFDLI